MVTPDKARHALNTRSNCWSCERFDSELIKRQSRARQIIKSNPLLQPLQLSTGASNPNLIVFVYSNTASMEVALLSTCFFSSSYQMLDTEKRTSRNVSPELNSKPGEFWFQHYCSQFCSPVKLLFLTIRGDREGRTQGKRSCLHRAVSEGEHAWEQSTGSILLSNLISADESCHIGRNSEYGVCIYIVQNKNSRINFYKGVLSYF